MGQNLGQIAPKPEAHWNTTRANPPTSLQCEEQDSNLHALRTLEPKSSASANSAILAGVTITGVSTSWEGLKMATSRLVEYVTVLVAFVRTRGFG